MKIKIILMATLALSLIFSKAVFAQASSVSIKPQPESQGQLTPEQPSPPSPKEIPQEPKNILTPQAIESLKTSQEFPGLTVEEIIKGKEILEEKKPLPQERILIAEEGIKTVFDRYRQIGRYHVETKGLKPFGYEFFKEAAVRVLTERKDIPVPEKYIVGPGDEVRVLLWGRVNAQYNLVIDRDGKINIPHIGPLYVGGMTYEQMAEHIITQVQQIIGANIDLTLGALKSIPIFVLGDVKRPGAYTVGSFATITDALLFAGGPNEIGSMRNIQLRRNDKLLVTFDLYDLLRKGDKSKDLILQAGDIVFVPVAGPLVAIAGNVKRPAIYELKDKYDLHTLIELAGGLVPSAYTQQIQIERIIKGEKQIVIDIDDKELKKAKDFKLDDGDVVKIFPIVDLDINAIYLYGNIKRPGKYEYKQGMRLKDLIRTPEDLKQETYFEYALIKRLLLPDLRTKLVPVNLSKIFLDNDESSNTLLEPQDTIYIFPKWFFKDRPFVIVEGEVRKPGRFELFENKKVKDAIFLAGDLTKDAYLKKGEIIRVDKDRQYKTIYFNVKKALEDDPVENILLCDEDRIIIHSIWEEKWKETVSISGEVKKPQEFLLTEDMKISDLVFKAGGLTRDTYLDEAELYRTDWRTKEVTLQRFNLKKALDGDPEHNILLKDLDRVVVHSIWEKVYKKTVSVSGEVLNPGTYQYAEGMTVKDLIFASGNVLESAYLEEAEISSQIVENGKEVKIKHRKINLAKAIEGDPIHNIELKPYDTLFVKRLADWGKKEFVTITGEVMFPGKYLIKKGERLSSLIERAGGFTKEAYLRGVVFTRENVRELQQKRIDEMIELLERELTAVGLGRVATAITPEEAALIRLENEQKRQFIERLKTVKAKGRMAINLQPLDKLKQTPYDIELEGGDSIYIPPKPGTVQVIGSVYNQTAFVYDKEKGLSDYIALAGGYTENADKKNVYILKVDGTAVRVGGGGYSLIWAKGSGWRFGSHHNIEPGDTIVVPEKLERIPWLRNIRDITQLLYHIAVTTGVLIAVL